MTKYEPGEVVRWRGRLFTVLRHDWDDRLVLLVDDENKRVSVHEGQVGPA